MQRARQGFRTLVGRFSSHHCVASPRMRQGSRDGVQASALPHSGFPGIPWRLERLAVERGLGVKEENIDILFAARKNKIK